MYANKLIKTITRNLPDAIDLVDAVEELARRAINLKEKRPNQSLENFCKTIFERTNYYCTLNSQSIVCHGLVRLKTFRVSTSHPHTVV